MLGSMAAGGLIGGIVANEKFGGGNRANIIGIVVGAIVGGLIYWGSSNAVGKASDPYANFKQAPQDFQDSELGK